MEELVGRVLYGDLAALAALVVVFLAVLALFFGVRYLIVSRTNVVKERAQRTVGNPTSSLIAELAGGPKQASPQAGQMGVLQQLMASFTKISRPTDEEELGRLRSKLTQAGFRSEMALVSYLAVKMVLCLGLGGLVLWLNATRTTPLRFAIFYTLVVMIIGFYLPNFWLHLKVRKRQSEVNHALPDALDLVVTCVEAGLGLDAAVDRVAEEIRISSPLLSSELTQSSLEMRAGMPRGEAFRRVAHRTGVEELHNLAAIIIQTDIFGTSVAKSLRVQADAMRIRRTQLAEERAATVAVKMTIPLVFCILPSLFSVLMGPAVVRIIRIMMPKLMGE